MSSNSSSTVGSRMTQHFTSTWGAGAGASAWTTSSFFNDVSAAEPPKDHWSDHQHYQHIVPHPDPVDTSSHSVSGICSWGWPHTWTLPSFCASPKHLWALLSWFNYDHFSTMNCLLYFSGVWDPKCLISALRWFLPGTAGTQQGRTAAHTANSKTWNTIINSFIPKKVNMFSRFLISLLF